MTWAKSLIKERHPDRLVVKVNEHVSVIRILDVEPSADIAPARKLGSDEGLIIKINPEVGEELSVRGRLQDFHLNRQVKTGLTDPTRKNKVIAVPGSNWGQVTITSPLVGGEVGSYTCWVPPKAMAAANPSTKSVYAMTLSGVIDGSGANVWLAKVIQKSKQRP
ncbi:MAG: hypothetical protein KC488_15915 [Candidatus Cloacimonetes bacterium]|nr:hypothetical protein [Candidatus Cloacimonadota bacterium]